MSEPAVLDTVDAAALEPVRAALRGRARAAAHGALAEAESDAARVLADAERQAAALLAEARVAGEVDATAALAGERARGRRRARAVVLAAQRAAYEQFRDRARRAVLALRDDPDYPRLVAGLTALARADLGPAAVVSPHPDGGVVAAASGRRVDYSLPVLADRAADGLGAEVQRLWTG
jgi:vacuolar-type H+-ATPase subunit E/Vma4